MRIPESELILNLDGSIYHLNLLPEDIADLIIVVGDPDRVQMVSRYFDHIELKKQKRELITHTGRIGNQRITALSTGMSTDNIDIVFNELDALANIDFNTRTIKPQTKRLKIIRAGTAGSLQAHIPIDSFVVSGNAVGLDGLANFYETTFSPEEIALQKRFAAAFPNDPVIQTCYTSTADAALTHLLGKGYTVGTTVSCAGFYGPQGRMLRAKAKINNFTDKLTQLGMANFEMEASAIFALGTILGHQTCSVSAIVANRVTQQFSTKPYESIDKLIRYMLERLVEVKVAETPETA
jgi:uridine phosphorylase